MNSFLEGINRFLFGKRSNILFLFFGIVFLLFLKYYSNINLSYLRQMDFNKNESFPVVSVLIISYLAGFSLNLITTFIFRLFIYLGVPILRKTPYITEKIKPLKRLIDSTPVNDIEIYRYLQNHRLMEEVYKEIDFQSLITRLFFGLALGISVLSCFNIFAKVFLLLVLGVLVILADDEMRMFRERITKDISNQ